jgi:hypothetical protein
MMNLFAAADESIDQEGERMPINKLAINQTDQEKYKEKTKPLSVKFVEFG